MEESPVDRIRSHRRSRDLTLLGVLALALSGLAAGCGSTTPPSGGGASAPGTTGPSAAPDSSAPTNAATGKIVMIAPPVANNVYWDAYSAAAAYAAATLGMDSHYANFNGDTNAQIAAFENAPTLGISGAVTMANQAAVSPQLFGTAQANGTMVVNSWSNQPWSTPLDIGDNYLQYLEISNDRSYQVLAELVFEKLGGTGKILHISGAAGNSASDARDAGLARALEKYPNIELLATEYGGFSRTTTIPIVENLLTTYPDVDAILAQNDDSALGAITVVKQRDIDPLIVGYDAVPEMIDAIAAGDAFGTIANNAPWLGGAAVVRIFDALNGVTYDPLERMMQFQSFVISTPEAATAYKDKFFSPGQFPYDYPKMSRFLHPDDWDPQAAMWAIRPEEYWASTPKPSGHELPAAYREATEASYAAIDSLYADHLSSNPFDEIIALTDPVAEVRSWR